ncbi:hypothetical protein GDO78_011895 [Eleutherodactylus coqui]|uniref:Uncharacterized protein n=1 Tax=Eleutherodactylus coqui TaxID=57060 RepID=A0A8J6K427_ELECQ|nr:hypothetical protein GDO78_011895 [Eleutherodactylus coqui]
MLRFQMRFVITCDLNLKVMTYHWYRPTFCDPENLCCGPLPFSHAQRYSWLFKYLVGGPKSK